MRKMSLTLLAASTMLIAGLAAAQPAGGPRAGTTWRGGTMGGTMQMGGGYQMRGNVRTGGSFQRHGGVFRGPGGGNWRFHRWGPRPGRDFRYGRLRRGGFINSFWFAPQFYIDNWQAYGFSAPGDDQRWVRYYDDAYLVDDYGRVVDTRYGVRWDRYGDDWDYQDGIPGYRGDWRDYDESEYAEDEGEGEDYADMRGHGGYGGPRGPMMPPPGYGPPPPGYAGPPPGAGGYTPVYGGYGGYGMYAYPIVIETVTTTGSSGYTEEVVEEYVQTAHRRRAHRARPRCSCARPAPRPVYRRPRPPAGERG